MANLTLSQPDLYSREQAALKLGADVKIVRQGVLALGLLPKLHPSRSGKLLDRGDIERIAGWLARTVDWGDEPRS